MLGLSGMRRLECFERRLCRLVTLFKCVIRSLQIGEFAILGTAVLDKLFSLGSKLSKGALGLCLCQLQVLSERFEFELQSNRLVQRFYVSTSLITFVDVPAERSLRSWDSRDCWSCLASLD